eukprot:TRINITY_DN3781_c2_g1_i1.p1 TRINITY_DN3781_c2_g1~~TRINITY_DN3781_c2_g1_i1.p1  ORF type:complete len:482 (+),score=100.92 TRINITY_DN3781_c2_g1_i1:33-1478(+)
MDDLERALTCTLAPDTPYDIRASAQIFLDQVKSSADGWKLCLAKALQTSNQQIQFYCLQVVQEVIPRYNGLSTEEKVDLRRALITYLQKICSSQEKTSPFVKNKLGQLFALLFKLDFLTTWPTFIDDLLVAVCSADTNKDQHMAIVDMFLRILHSIDEEVVSLEVVRDRDEQKHNQDIKDKMRENAIPKIVDTWYNLLVTYNNHNEILKNVLQNIGDYIQWIDVSLIVSERFLSIFGNLLSNVEVRSDVLHCFYEIVNKGMYPKDKIQMLNLLRLHEFIAGISTEVNDDNALEFLLSVARLINISGGEVMRAMTKLYESDRDAFKFASDLLELYLPLLFKYMAHEDDEISETVAPFTRDYLLQILKKTATLTEAQDQHLTLLLQIIAHKIKYDEQYNFERYGEYEEATKEYRKTLSNIFKTITQIAPQKVAAFMGTRISTIPEQDTFSIEATLLLFLKVQKKGQNGKWKEETGKKGKRVEN